MEKVPMTAEGYKALDEDLKRLKTVERPAVIAAITAGRSSVFKRFSSSSRAL